MRARTALSVMTAIFLVVLLATAAWASNPKFHSASADVASNGDLLVSYRITGLGQGENVLIGVSWTGGSITWDCVNKGGNSVVPHAGSVDPGAAEFNEAAGRNGQVSRSDRVAFEANATCHNPRQWRVQNVSATYEDVEIRILPDGPVGFGPEDVSS